MTEAGNRGALDTINWAIELEKPILALDWGVNETNPVRLGCHILRELSQSDPDIDKLEPLLHPYWVYATRDYDFTCAHPDKMADEVSSGGSDNDRGYKTSYDLGRLLVKKLQTYRTEHGGVGQITLIPASDVMPPHSGERRERFSKAAKIADELKRF